MVGVGVEGFVVEIMIWGGFWRWVVIVRIVIVIGRIILFMVFFVFLGMIYGIFES